MLASEKQTVDDKIVQILSDKPAQTAAEIFQRVEKQLKKKPTVRGWYKALRRLVAQEVLVKDKKTYSLNARWLLSVVRWMERAEKSHLGHSPVQAVQLPDEGKRITFHFKNLIEMDAFWGHLLMRIASQTKKPIYYCYAPHFWYYLAHGQAESEFHKGMKQFRVQMRYLIGSDSFLDRWSMAFFDTSFRYWLHPVPVYNDNRLTFNYFGGYFIEAKISQETAKEIEELFASVKSLNDISQLTLIKIFHNESPCALTISRSKTKGERLKSRVERFLSKK